MKLKVFLIALALLVGHGKASMGQPQTGKLGVGLAIGGSKLYGDIDNTNTAFTGGLMLRQSLSQTFALSATSTYGKMTSGLNAFKTEVFNTSISGTIFLHQAPRYRPYLSIGMAYFHYSAKDGNDNQLFYPDGSKVGGWKSAFKVGGGIELFAGNQWAINTTADYIFAGVDDLEGIDQGANDGFFRGLIGLVRYFKNDKHVDEPTMTATKSYAHSVNEAPKEIEEVETVEEMDEPEKPDPIRKKEIAAQSDESTATTEATTEETRTKQGIYFEPGSTRIQEESKQQLYLVYKHLKEHPEEEIELLASANSVYNENSLIVRRAKSVKAYLVALGIAPQRIIIDTNAYE